jgi:hypothetical protein
MNSLDNMMLHQLYDKLDHLIEERKLVKQYRNAPLEYTVEEYLQELDEEETYIRMKIEELSIVQDDFMDDEF